MSSFSRRSFLRGTGLGAAALTTSVAMPAIVRSAHAAEVVFNPDDTAPIIARARRSSMPPPPREQPRPQDPDAPLPDDPVEMLRALLGRIRGGRRRKPAGA